MNRRMALWGGAVTGAGIAGAVLASLVLPSVSWPAVAAGWMVAVINSLAGRLINRRAVGTSHRAFIGWGIVGNAFRVLTLVGIFAFIAFSHQEERGSFFVMVFVVFFVLMGVEVANLFISQNRDGESV